MSNQGKNTVLILNVSAAGAGASFFFQLGPDVGAVAQFELSLVATVTLEGRMDPLASFAPLLDASGAAITVTGAANTFVFRFIGRMVNEVRANVTSYTSGTIRVWVQA